MSAFRSKVATTCKICGKWIHPARDFKDCLSKEEFLISGMCQECQDEIFKEED